MDFNVIEGIEKVVIFGFINLLLLGFRGKEPNEASRMDTHMKVPLCELLLEIALCVHVFFVKLVTIKAGHDVLSKLHPEGLLFFALKSYGRALVNGRISE